MFDSASLSSLPRRFCGALAVGAVVAVVGCSSGGASSTPASAPATTAPVTTAPVSTAPATSPAASSATPVPAQTTSSAPAGPAACATQGLRVALGRPNGAAGSTYLPIDFTNTSGTKCTLYGYPGVSLRAGTPSTQVGAAATRSTAQTPSLVTLAPGQTANALLRIVNALNFPQATCSPTPATELRVYPPNQTVPVDLPYKTTGCGANSVKLLTIGVVQPGAGGQ